MCPSTGETECWACCWYLSHNASLQPSDPLKYYAGVFFSKLLQVYCSHVFSWFYLLHFNSKKNLIFGTGHITLLMSSYWWKWEALSVLVNRFFRDLITPFPPEWKQSAHRVNRNQTRMFVVPSHLPSQFCSVSAVLFKSSVTFSL